MANDQKHLLVIARLIAGALIGGGDAAAGQAIAGYVEDPQSEAEASVPVNRTVMAAKCHVVETKDRHFDRLI